MLFFEPPNGCRETQHTSHLGNKRGKAFQWESSGQEAEAWTKPPEGVLLLRPFLEVVFTVSSVWFLLRVWLHVGLLLIHCCMSAVICRPVTPRLWSGLLVLAIFLHYLADLTWCVFVGFRLERGCWVVGVTMIASGLLNLCRCAVAHCDWKVRARLESFLSVVLLMGVCCLVVPFFTTAYYLS